MMKIWKPRKIERETWDDKKNKEKETKRGRRTLDPLPL